MSKDILGEYKLVLGLEVHLHLKTKRKMFCRCDADVFGKEPNTHTCPTCLGLPGALPVPNQEAIRKAQLLGLALNSKIMKTSRFDRKHYFYPDLPKGYQISQYKNPLCEGGFMELSSGKEAEIERVHLEEDTAKSIHEKGKTLVDYNVSSIPLVEIVSKPTFRNIEDAVEFCKKVQKVVRELGLGDADMEKGQMRMEPNISLRTKEMEEKEELPSYKVEIKNINSFRFMEKAVRAEIRRQKEMLESGETPVQENRGYIEEKKATVSQRSKEHAHDYRYFPEPDIPPMKFDEKYISEVGREYKNLRSKSPTQKKKALAEELSLVKNIEERLIEELTTDEIQKIIDIADEGYEKLSVINSFLNKKDIRKKSVKDIIKIFNEEKEKVSDESVLRKAVGLATEQNQDAVESYLKGKENALQFLIGMVMKETRGKADAEIVRELLLEKIKD